MGGFGLSYYVFLTQSVKEDSGVLCPPCRFDLQFFAEEEKTEEPTPRKKQRAQGKKDKSHGVLN